MIGHNTTRNDPRAHTDYGVGYFSNHFLLVILLRIKGVCCLENNSIGQWTQCFKTLIYVTGVHGFFPSTFPKYL